MSAQIGVEPISVEAFAPFADPLEARGTPDVWIIQGLCGRYHDRAGPDLVEGRAGISLFKAELRDLPLTLDMMEPHPLESQASFRCRMTHSWSSVPKMRAIGPKRRAPS